MKRGETINQIDTISIRDASKTRVQFGKKNTGMSAGDGGAGGREAFDATYRKPDISMHSSFRYCIER